MFEQTLIDTLIVIGIFGLRISIPIALVAVLGKWLENKLAPQEEIRGTANRVENARIIPFQTRSSANLATSAQDKPEKRVNIK